MVAPLPTRRLGRTGIELTVVGLGGAPLGELFETIEESTAQQVLQTAFNAGIRYFDTAPWYGHGLSEHRFGHFLRYRDRGSFMVSTKVGRVYRRSAGFTRERSGPWVGGLPFEPRFDYSHAGIMRSYEDSLQRLGMNRIDCLLIHDLDTGYHSPAETLERHRRELMDSGWSALEALRSGGEIGAIGAGINDQRMMAWFWEHLDLDFFLVAMPYTLLDQEPLHTEFEECRRRGMGIVIGSPFASGILATGPAPDAIYNYAPATPEVLEKTRRIEAVCREFDVPLQAAALQFPLGHAAVAAVVPGATRSRFVEANIENLLTPIPAAFWEALKSTDLIDASAPTPVMG